MLLLKPDRTFDLIDWNQVLLLVVELVPTHVSPWASLNCGIWVCYRGVFVPQLLLFPVGPWVNVELKETHTYVLCFAHKHYFDGVNHSLNPIPHSLLLSKTATSHTFRGVTD